MCFKMSDSATAGYAFNASHQDVIFVNGGLQPAIRIAPGIPQLWRIVNAAWKAEQLLSSSLCHAKSSRQLRCLDTHARV